MLFSPFRVDPVSFGAPLRRSHLLCSANRRGCTFAFVLLAAAFALAFPAASPAAVIERDFVPGSGDGLLTYDTVNRREWLDLTVFADAWSSDDVFADAVRNPDFDFEAEFAELAPGGIYEDFTLATTEDVLAFSVSAGIDTSTLNFATNDVTADRLVDLLGATRTNATTAAKWSIGFVREFDTLPEDPLFFSRFAAKFRHAPLSTSAGVLMIAFDGFIRPEYTGLMLNRNVVPEPSAACLVYIGVAAFLLRVILRVERRVH